MHDVGEGLNCVRGPAAPDQKGIRKVLTPRERGNMFYTGAPEALLTAASSSRV